MSNEFETVESIRDRLRKIGIAATPEQIIKAKTIKPREEIIRALTVADTNPKAKTYLQQLIAAIVEPVPAKPALPPPAAASAPAPSRPVLVPAPAQNAARAPTAIPHGQASGPVPVVRPPGAPPVPVPAPESKADGFHIYGGKAALTVEPGENRNGKPVVFIDAAPAIAERKYDWEQKIRLMLTPSEVVNVLAVALGYIPSAEFKNHGEDSDKWFVVENQKKNLFIKVGQGKTLRAVPVSAFDAFRFAAVLTAQVRKQVPQQAAADIQTLVRLVAAPMFLAQRPAA